MFQKPQAHLSPLYLVITIQRSLHIVGAQQIDNTFNGIEYGWPRRKATFCLKESQYRKIYGEVEP